MKIVLIIGKKKQNAIKIVIFKKAIKKGTIIHKRHILETKPEFREPFDNKEKCMIFNTIYTIKSEIQELGSIGNITMAIAKEYIEILTLKAIKYNKGYIEYTLEFYSEGKNRVDANAYQMNLIGAKIK